MMMFANDALKRILLIRQNFRETGNFSGKYSTIDFVDGGKKTCLCQGSNIFNNIEYVQN